MTPLGSRLRRLRVNAGLSQKDLAKGLPRVTSAYVSRIENGQREPSLRTLVGLASRLPGVTGLQLLTGRRNAKCPLCRRSA